jgi:hypothetical protein
MGSIEVRDGLRSEGVNEPVVFEETGGRLRPDPCIGDING